MTCNKINYYTCMYHYFWKLFDCFWLRSLNHIYRYIASMNFAVPGRVWVICKFRFLRCFWLFVRFAGMWHVFTCQVFPSWRWEIFGPRFIQWGFQKNSCQSLSWDIAYYNWRVFFPCQFIIWELKEISKRLALWGLPFPMWE